MKLFSVIKPQIPWARQDGSIGRMPDEIFFPVDGGEKGIDRCFE